MLLFGDIEYVSIMYLQAFPKDKIASSVSELPFARRADLLIEMLEARPARSAPLDELIGGFKRARGLAKTRNLIAHNPLLFTLYFDASMEKIERTEHVISSQGGGVQVDLEKLKEFAAEVDSLASEMWMAFLRETEQIDAMTRSAIKKS